MRRTKAEIEASIPPPQDRAGVEGVGGNSLPQIRRQVERICESIGVEYDDLTEMRIEPGILEVFFYARDESGSHYLDEFGDAAKKARRIAVDTSTFVGDERDF